MARREPLNVNIELGLTSGSALLVVMATWGSGVSGFFALLAAGVGFVAGWRMAAKLASQDKQQNERELLLLRKLKAAEDTSEPV